MEAATSNTCAEITCGDDEIATSYGECCASHALATCVDQAPDGATLHVGSGTFDWPFHFEGVIVSDKHITIIGAGASNTVLDRHGGGRFFTILAP